MLTFSGELWRTFPTDVMVDTTSSYFLFFTDWKWNKFNAMCWTIRELLAVEGRSCQISRGFFSPHVEKIGRKFLKMAILGGWMSNFEKVYTRNYLILDNAK